jgi:hypothetical protein
MLMNNIQTWSSFACGARTARFWAEYNINIKEIADFNLDFNDWFLHRRTGPLEKKLFKGYVIRQLTL